MTNLEKRIQKYYQKYYKRTLNLPNWEEMLKFRLGEEKTEKEKIVNLTKILGSFAKKKILDVGCGTGGFAIVAAKNGARVWGIDPDREAVEICKLKARSLEKGEANFKLGFAESLGFTRNFFDIVFCYTVLEHVANVEKALAEMIRVTKPGGAVYIQTPNYLSCFEGHYKVFWLPLFPKSLASVYLKLRGRNPEFLKTINYLTPAKLKRYLENQKVKLEFLEHEDKRTQGIFNFPLKLFYWLFNIDPQIELIIQKV